MTSRSPHALRGAIEQADAIGIPAANRYALATKDERLRDFDPVRTIW